MNTFEILLNNSYSASTTSGESSLTLQDDYYVYVNKNGGGIVNPSNVRGFLNDPKNQQVTKDFFSYLTGSTTHDQSLNILTSDQKLSSTFNSYYLLFVVSATTTNNTAIIQQNLTGTNQSVEYTFNHPWSGSATPSQLTGITQGISNSVNSSKARAFLDDVTTEQSYYVPVYLERGTNQIAQSKFELCGVSISKQTAGFYPIFSGISSAYFGASSIASLLPSPPVTSSLSGLFDPNAITNVSTIDINTISILGQTAAPVSAFSNIITALTPVVTSERVNDLINCFVDLNLETNENIGAAAPVPKVTFEFNSYDIDEGTLTPLINTSFDIIIGLDSPSVSGIEEVTVILSTPVVDPAILGTDFAAADTYPLTLTWAIGEQFKTLSFAAWADYFLESKETFSLSLTGLINVNPGLYTTTSIGITDKTVLRRATLSVGAPNIAILNPLELGLYKFTTRENNVFDITITLDGPAYGIETLNLNSVASTYLPFAFNILNNTFGKTVDISSRQATIDVDWRLEPNPVPINMRPLTSSVYISFLPGETQKTFTFSSFSDTVIENSEAVLLEILNPSFCLINPLSRVLQVDITDDTGGFKYVHLNLGRIYSEFGDSKENTKMRQLNPTATYNNSNYIDLSRSNFNLIKYNTTINYAYNVNGFHKDSIAYSNTLVKVKITNTGTITSMVNDISIAPGQSTILNVPGNDFIITATTNDDKNLTTNLFDYADYKIEMVNNYVGKTVPNGMVFKTRAKNNTLAAGNTIDLGTYSLSGMTTSKSNVSGQYKLKSTYKNINTARYNNSPNPVPNMICPPVGNVVYSQFYSTELKNVSILGIIFLNYNANANYTTNTVSTYDKFEFIPAVTPYVYTCTETNSSYNNLTYISLPNKIEP